MLSNLGELDGCLWRSRGTAEYGEVTDPLFALFALFDGLVKDVTITLFIATRSPNYISTHRRITALGFLQFMASLWNQCLL